MELRFGATEEKPVLSAVVPLLQGKDGPLVTGEYDDKEKAGDRRKGLSPRSQQSEHPKSIT